MVAVIIETDKPEDMDGLPNHLGSEIDIRHGTATPSLLFPFPNLGSPNSLHYSRTISHWPRSLEAQTRLGVFEALDIGLVQIVFGYVWGWSGSKQGGMHFISHFWECSNCRTTQLTLGRERFNLLPAFSYLVCLNLVNDNVALDFLCCLS